MALTRIKTDGITDGSILNADINASAAIALSKLSTSGTASSSTYLRGDGAWSTVSSSGGATGTDYDDNVAVRFGAGYDLSLRSDGSSGYIQTQHSGGTLYLGTSSSTNLMNISYLGVTFSGETHWTNGNHINLNDSSKIIIGTHDDLTLWHDASNPHSHIKHDGTGHLKIQAVTGDIRLEVNGNEKAVECEMNSSTNLYFDNSKKLETTSTGISVTGHVFASSNVYSDKLVSTTQSNSHSMYINARNAAGSEATLIKGTIGGAVELNHNTYKKLETLSSGIRVNDWNLELKAPDNNEARLAIIGDNGDDDNDWSRITSYNGVYKWQNMASGGWETNIECNGNGNVELYYDNAKKCETTTNGLSIAANNDIRFNNGNWTGDSYGKIQHHDNRIYFGIGSNGIIFRESGTNRWEIDGSGHFIPAANDTYDIGTSSNRVGNLYTVDVFASGNVDLEDAKAVKLGTDDDLQLHHTSGVNYIDCYADLLVRNETSETMIDCNRNGAVELFYDGSKKLETLSDGIKVNNGAGSSVYLNMSTSSGSSGYLYGGSNQIGILSEDQEWHVKCNKNAEVELYHDNSMKMETNSNGISVDGNIGFVSSGQGIDFGATANSSGSMTSELFDDYEEGTWTPVLEASSSNPSYGGGWAGVYTKMGRVVVASGYVDTNPLNSNGSGDLRITGFPFQAANITGNQLPFHANIITYGPNWGGDGYQLSGTMNGSTPRLDLKQSQNNGGMSNWTWSEAGWSQGNAIYFQITYHAS